MQSPDGGVFCHALHVFLALRLENAGLESPCENKHILLLCKKTPGDNAYDTDISMVVEYYQHYPPK